MKNKLILLSILFCSSLVCGIVYNPFKILDGKGEIDSRGLERTIQDLYFRKADKYGDDIFGSLNLLSSLNVTGVATFKSSVTVQGNISIPNVTTPTTFKSSITVQGANASIPNITTPLTVKSSVTITDHTQVYQLKVTSPTILFGGQIHYSSVTNINTQNVYERVAGTSTFDTDETSWFDMPDNNQWRYRDDRTKHFRIIVTGYYQSVSGSDTFEYALYKNGNRISVLTEMDGKVTAVSNNEQFVCIGATTLSTNDIVDLRVKNKTGAGDLAFVNYTIMISPNH